MYGTYRMLRVCQAPGTEMNKDTVAALERKSAVHLSLKIQENIPGAAMLGFPRFPPKSTVAQGMAWSVLSETSGRASHRRWPNAVKVKSTLLPEPTRPCMSCPCGTRLSLVACPSALAPCALATRDFHSSSTGHLILCRSVVISCIWLLNV